MNILQIEENLSALQEQRRYLDQKIANKFQSLAKFENIRANSNTRLHNAIIEQNEKASMRNKELLTKLSQLSVSTVIKHNNNRHNCAQNLNDAKLEYQKKMEATLPFHYRQNAIQLEEKIKMLKIEKLQSQQRRERIRLELDNEDRAKTELEQQRRELMVLRALEQQDFLRSEANSAILHEEGRFVDESIAQQLGLATNVLNRMVSESKRNTIQMTKDYQLEHISQARQNDSVSIHLLPPLPSNQSHQTRLVNPSIQVEQIKSHLPDNAAPDHNSQPTNTTNRSSSAVTVEIEAARHFQPTLQAVVELSPASSTDNSPIKSAPQSVERSRQIHFESSSNTPTVQSRNLSSSRLDDEGDDEFEFEAADLQEQTYLGVASENDTSLRSTAPPTLQFEKELPTTSSFELNDDEGQNPTPKSSPDHHHSRFSPQKTSSPHREEVDPWAKEEDSQQNQQHQQPEKMKEVKEMEFVQPEPVQQTVATPEDLRVLLNDVKQCVVCVRQLFAAIEHRVMFSAHVTSIYTFSSIPSISRTNAMVQYVSLLLGGGGLGERDRLLLEEFNGNERLVGDTVLAILQTHSALLVPKEAFTGVVTLDKLYKEYKKGRAPAAVLELWEGLALHLQKVVEVNSSYRSDLANCFTSALVSHVPSDDLDRFTRKVSNLLGLVLGTGNGNSPHPPGAAGAASLRSLPGGGSSSSTASKPARYISYDSMQLPVSRASEFEDDELMEEEVVERPPALRDIDHRAQRAQDDEFDF